MQKSQTVELDFLNYNCVIRTLEGFEYYLSLNYWEQKLNILARLFFLFQIY